MNHRSSPSTLRYTIPLATLLLTAGLLACAGPEGDIDTAPTPEGTTLELAVSGMTCGGCSVAVERAVGRLDGVHEVEAWHREGRARVVYDPERVQPEAIAAAIEDIGFEASLPAR
jgi:copper chaperone CopZ